MDEFVTADQLKKEQYVRTVDVRFARHCAMDILLEELAWLSDVDVLVLGVGECAFYSRKAVFPDNRRNWAYELTDKEIVFGDTQEIRKAVEELSASGRFVVAIVTCVPSIMNFDLGELEDSFPLFRVIFAPDFKGISETDCLSDLYCILLKNCESGIKEGISVWTGEERSVAEMQAKLACKAHIVKSRKYLSFFEKQAGQGSVELIDDCSFFSLKYYETRREKYKLAESDIAQMRRATDKLKALGPLRVAGPFAADFALFLQEEGGEIESVAFGSYDLHTYEACKKFNPSVKIYINRTAGFSGRGSIDLFSRADEIFALNGAKRLGFMLGIAEEICR